MTFLLYYIGWKCTSSNAWSGGRVNLLTSPRLDLTIDLMNRFKRLFTERNLLQFDDKSTICNINGVRVECFPSHTGLKSMRGLTDVHAIICDESSFFDANQSQEVIETLERYYAKTNPLIILCSTPSKVNDLMDIIRQQPEDKCFYHRMYLSYKVGLNRIYTPQEIAIQKKSLSFEKEYNLSFELGIDALFNAQDLEIVFSDKYDTSDEACTLPSMSRWCGVDCGYATSAFGIVIIQWRDNKMEVVYESEVKNAEADSMRTLIHSLVTKYHLCRIFCDGSSVSFVRSLCSDYGINDVTLYDDKTRDQLLLTSGCGGEQLIHSVTFRTKHRLILEQLHRIVSTHQIRVDPIKFPKVATALRTATNKPNSASIWDLDKTQSSSNDVLDALRLSLLCLRSDNN